MAEAVVNPSSAVANGVAVTTASPMPVTLVGGIVATAITVGTTTITGGTASGILWNNAGVLASGPATTNGSGATNTTTLSVGTNTVNKGGVIYGADDSTASLYLDGSGGGRGGIFLRNSGGTQAARTASPDNSTIGNVWAFPYTPSGGYTPGCAIDFVIDGAVTNGQAPGTRLNFWTNPSNGAIALAFTIRADKSAQFFGALNLAQVVSTDIVASGGFIRGANATRLDLTTNGIANFVNDATTNAALVVSGNGIALTAGGSTAMGFRASSSLMGVYFGSGAPSISVGKGSLYLRSDGSTTITRAYIATDGVGTWTPLTTVG